MRCATRIFQSRSRACPSSSMSRQITAAPYSLGQGEHPVEPRSGSVAILEVGRIEHASSAEALQPGLHDRGFGGIDHAGTLDWVARRRTNSSTSAVPSRPHVIDANIEYVGTLADLILGDGDAPVRVPASRSSRNFFDPLAFVRSPMMRNEVSWSNGVKA